MALALLPRTSHVPNPKSISRGDLEKAPALTRLPSIVKTQYPLRIEVTFSFHASLDCCAAPEGGAPRGGRFSQQPLASVGQGRTADCCHSLSFQGTFIQCKRPCEADTVSILCLRTLQPRKFGSSMKDKAQNWLSEELPSPGPATSSSAKAEGESVLGKGGARFPLSREKASSVF